MRRHRPYVSAAVAVAAVVPTCASWPAVAAPPDGVDTLKPALRPVAFLVGDWAGDAGHGEGGMTLAGTSAIHADVGGAVLVRRDHTTMTAADDHPLGGFDQLMPIYPEAGTLHADSFDGEHTIHYTSPTVDPGESVTFATAAGTPGTAFRLTYAVVAPDELTVKFEMAAPGGTDFHVVAQGKLHRRA